MNGRDAELCREMLCAVCCVCIVRLHNSGATHYEWKWEKFNISITRAVRVWSALRGMTQRYREPKRRRGGEKKKSDSAKSILYITQYCDSFIILKRNFVSQAEWSQKVSARRLEFFLWNTEASICWSPESGENRKWVESERVAREEFLLCMITEYWVASERHY